MSKEIIRIGISGSYGGYNLGDEAILQSILKTIHTNFNAEVLVFTRDADDTMARHKVYKAINPRTLSKIEIRDHISNLDFLILGGGGILYDQEAKTFLREPLIAIEENVPFMVYAVSAGPLKDPSIQSQISTVLSQAQAITVRDTLSRNILEESGVKKEIIVTADPAMLIEPEALSQDIAIREHLDTGRTLIGMSVREPGGAAPDLIEENYQTILADCADFMIDRYQANVVFIPMERKARDLQQSHRVISRMLRAQHATVVQGEFSPGQLCTIIQHFSLCVGMRLHFLFFAALGHVPFVGLPYSPKVISFLEEMHVGIPPLQLVNAGRVISHIDKIWDNREGIKRGIIELLPSYKSRAHKNEIILIDILKKNIGKLPKPHREI